MEAMLTKAAKELLKIKYEDIAKENRTGKALPCGASGTIMGISAVKAVY